MQAVILIRILVGWVFISEGIQKFLFPQALGVGRFAGIGIPIPQISAPFVGFIEIICGVLILLGLFTRLAAIPLLVDMIVAIVTTKVPILTHQGIWPFLHESRVDFSMFLGLIFLLIVGAGPASVDHPRRRFVEYRARRAQKIVQPTPVTPVETTKTTVPRGPGFLDYDTVKKEDVPPAKKP